MAVTTATFAKKRPFFLKPGMKHAKIKQIHYITRIKSREAQEYELSDRERRRVEPGSRFGGPSFMSADPGTHSFSLND